MSELVEGRWPLAAPPAPAGAPVGGVPSLSVIIAAYQAAGVIGDAVGSALGQTVPPLEVIVCDDGSTDDLAGALAPFGDRVRVLRQANGGEAAAKNAAAAAASGDYVVVLDADDVFEPERLEALGACLAARPDLDLLTTDGWVELGGRRVRRVYHDGFRFEVADQPREILRSNFVFGLAAVRRARMEELGGFDPAIRHTTDWDLWLRMIRGGSPAGCIELPLARYRLQDGSLSSQRAPMLAGRLQTLAKARATQSLTPDELAVVDDAARRLRARLRRQRAIELLAARAPGRRRAALRAALWPGQHPLGRLKLAGAALLPERTARRLATRPRETTGGLYAAPPGAAGGAPTDPAGPPR